jgi:hypothetical protein
LPPEDGHWWLKYVRQKRFDLFTKIVSLDGIQGGFVCVYSSKVAIISKYYYDIISV